MLLITEVPLFLIWKASEWPRRKARRLFRRVLAITLVLSVLCVAAAAVLMIAVPILSWGWLVAMAYFIAMIPLAVWYAGFEQVHVVRGVSYFFEDDRIGGCLQTGGFESPGLAECRRLQQGQVAGLVLWITAEGKCQAEWMWVVVDGLDLLTLDGYCGRLLNGSRCTETIRQGLRVRFRPRHVMAIPEELEGRDDGLQRAARHA